MRASKLFFYVLLCLTIVLSTATPALAEGQGGDSPNPRDGEQLTFLLAEADDTERAQIWVRLPNEEKYAVVEYNTVVKVTSEDIFISPLSGDRNTTSNILASGCDVRGKKEKGYNVFGQVVWEYYSRVEWCYNGTNVTSKFATRSGKPGPFPSLWEYLGDAVPPVQGGGVSQTYYRIWVNGYFKFAIAGYPIQSNYPWIDITVRGNGTNTASSGQ